MALATSNLSVNSILAALGAPSAKAIFYTGGVLKTASQLGAIVTKDGLNATYCPGATPDARLGNLLTNRKLSYFKGYVSLIPFISTSPSGLVFEGDGGSKTLTLTSNIAWTITRTGMPWTVTCSSYSGTGNATITVSTGANTGQNDRTGYLTISGAGATSVSVVILQYGMHV